MIKNILTSNADAILIGGDLNARSAMWWPEDINKTDQVICSMTPALVTHYFNK
jgi:hypothetical protein